MNLIPYFNVFSGWDRPQSVARAGVSGGVLRNTGINFEIDGLNGHPTLDATAADSFGGALGVDLIGDDFNRQWILETAYASPHGDRAFISGDQFALGTRYQFAISHRSIIRMDAMHAWVRGDENLYGTRIEYRLRQRVLAHVPDRLRHRPQRGHPPQPPRRRRQRREQPRLAAADARHGLVAEEPRVALNDTELLDVSTHQRPLWRSQPCYRAQVEGRSVERRIDAPADQLDTIHRTGDRGVNGHSLAGGIESALRCPSFCYSL
jgi:hypothetical protein